MADITTLSDTDLALRLAKALGWEVTERSVGPAWFCQGGDRTGALVTWLLTGDGMLRVLDAMRERGWEATMNTSTEQDYLNDARFERRDADVSLSAVAPTLPRAVAEAALSALESA